MDDHKKLTHSNFQFFFLNFLAAMVVIVVTFGPLSILLEFTHKFFDENKYFWN